MLNILSSPANDPSKKLTEKARKDGETNLEWLAGCISDYTNEAWVLLLGGTDPYAFRLRVAQSHVRHDMSPSRWSHTAILSPRNDNPESWELCEISLQPHSGFGFPASTNGVQRGTAARYTDAEKFPNLAVLRMDMKWEAVSKALHQFQRQRTTIDAKELILHWLAFVWGVGRSGNPLLDGHGIPSAVMVETVFAATGYDLTPGLESGASCPEAIWQSARWWDAYYSEQEKVPMQGSWTADHRIG